MKPTKNRVFCIGVKRSKMLFESREKADNFIKFNSAEILEENGKAPVRSYYCVFCGDWHVTSSMSTVVGEHLDDRDNGIISMVMDSKEKEKNTKEISSQLALIRRNIDAGKIWLAEERLEDCKRIFQDMKVSKRETIKETIDDISHKIELLKQFLDMDSKAQNAALASEEYADIIWSKKNYQRLLLLIPKM